MTRATFYRDNVSRFVIVAFSSPLPFPSRFHFGSSDHRGKSSYCSMEEPSLTFGTAPSSRRLLPKIQNYSALRGHYVMTSLLFRWGNGTMLPLEITRKLRHQSLLSSRSFAAAPLSAPREKGDSIFPSRLFLNSVPKKEKWRDSS